MSFHPGLWKGKLVILAYGKVVCILDIFYVDAYVNMTAAIAYVNMMAILLFNYSSTLYQGCSVK